MRDRENLEDKVAQVMHQMAFKKKYPQKEIYDRRDEGEWWCEGETVLTV